jgi:hypothetical protein
MLLDNKMSTSKKLGEIALIFLSFINQLKIYHFQTRSYARHKASDGLVNIISDQMDRFMETMQGSRDMRIKMTSSSYVKLVNQNDTDIVNVLKVFKTWLVSGLVIYLDSNDKDLLNIRDEILGTVNKTLYLFTLN